MTPELLPATDGVFVPWRAIPPGLDIATETALIITDAELRARAERRPFHRDSIVIREVTSPYGGWRVSWLVPADPLQLPETALEEQIPELEPAEDPLPPWAVWAYVGAVIVAVALVCAWSLMQP